MNRVSLVVLLTTVFAIGFALDCSNIIVKEREGLLDYLANITFTVPISTSNETGGWRLSLLFDEEFTFFAVWDAFSTSNGTIRSATIVNNTGNAELHQGDERSQRFQVRYGRFLPIPEVISCRFQDTELCL